MLEEMATKLSRRGSETAAIPCSMIRTGARPVRGQRCPLRRPGRPLGTDRGLRRSRARLSQAPVPVPDGLGGARPGPGFRGRVNQCDVTLCPGPTPGPARDQTAHQAGMRSERCRAERSGRSRLGDRGPAEETRKGDPEAHHIAPPSRQDCAPYRDPRRDSRRDPLAELGASRMPHRAFRLGPGLLRRTGSGVA